MGDKHEFISSSLTNFLCTSSTCDFKSLRPDFTNHTLLEYIPTTLWPSVERRRPHGADLYTASMADDDTIRPTLFSIAGNALMRLLRQPGCIYVTGNIAQFSARPFYTSKSL